MPKFVRVKSKKTGSEYTLPATAPLGDDVTVIDKPAVNADGKPLPAKHKTTVEPSGRRESEPPTQDDGKKAESKTSKESS